MEQNAWKRPIYFRDDLFEDTKIGHRRLSPAMVCVPVVPMKRNPDPNNEPIDEPVLRKDLLEEIRDSAEPFSPDSNFAV